MNKTVFMISMALLILGGLTLGLQVILKKNIMNTTFKQYAWIPFALIGLAAIAVGFSRDTYLPFLGETVMPCSLLKDSIPENATHYTKVHVSPGTKVLYWAAEPENEELDSLKDWRQAYLGFKNAGVVTADKNGVAILEFRKPQPYKVPFTGNIESHIHYRTCINQGLMSNIKTIWTFVEKEIPTTPSISIPSVESSKPVNTISEPYTKSDTDYEFEPFTNAIDEFMNKVEEETISNTPILNTVSYSETFSSSPEGVDSNREKSTPEMMNGSQKDSFMDFVPANFVSEEAPRKATDDNTLYYLASETENSRIPMDMFGIDESPQPAASDYATAFISEIPQ